MPLKWEEIREGKKKKTRVEEKERERVCGRERERESGISSQDVGFQTQNSETTAATKKVKDQFRLEVRKKQGEHKKNELERYMEDDVEDDYAGFDILRWWRGKTGKYHVISRMARDILAIPLSTVSSEAAFSTRGRVLDPYRSSLNPTTVEALIYTQNWLKPSKISVEGQPAVEGRVIEAETDVSAVTGLEEAEVDSVFESMRNSLQILAWRMI